MRHPRAAVAMAALVLASGCGKIASDEEAASEAPGAHSRLMNEQNQLGRCVLDGDALFCSACLVPIDTYEGPCGATGMRIVRVPTAGGPAVEVARDAGVPAWLMAAAGGYVYWIADGGDDLSDGPALHPLRRVPRDGGPIETLAAPTGLDAAGSQIAVGLVATRDAVHVLYERFGATPGRYAVASWSATTGAMHLTSSEDGPPQTTVLGLPFATDGTSLFYALADRVTRVDPDGTKTHLLAISKPMADLTVASGRVYALGFGGELVQVGTDGTGSTTTKLRGQGQALVVDGASAYALLLRGQDQSTLALARVDLATGSSHDVTAVTEMGASQVFVDALNLYWVTSAAQPGGSNVAGQVVRLRKPE
jgi:hypothetical protein